MTFEDHMKEPVEAIVKAIRNKGSHPEYHDEIAELFEEKWPTLWEALELLLAAYDDFEGKGDPA